MLTCPMCRAELAGPAPRCPRCQSDLSLLADFVTDLKTLLDQADARRQSGDLAAAVAAYLAVLDVDPTNAEARAAVGPVLLAIRAAGRADPPRATTNWPLLLIAVLLAAAAGFSAATFLRL